MSGDTICFTTINSWHNEPGWKFGDGLRFDWNEFRSDTGEFEMSPPFGELMTPSESYETFELARKEREKEREHQKERFENWRDQRDNRNWKKNKAA